MSKKTEFEKGLNKLLKRELSNGNYLKIFDEKTIEFLSNPKLIKSNKNLNK